MQITTATDTPPMTLHIVNVVVCALLIAFVGLTPTTSAEVVAPGYWCAAEKVFLSSCSPTFTRRNATAGAPDLLQCGSDARTPSSTSSLGHPSSRVHTMSSVSPILPALLLTLRLEVPRLPHANWSTSWTCPPSTTAADAADADAAFARFQTIWVNLSSGVDHFRLPVFVSCVAASPLPNGTTTVSGKMIPNVTAPLAAWALWLEGRVAAEYAELANQRRGSDVLVRAIPSSYHVVTPRGAAAVVTMRFVVEPVSITVPRMGDTLWGGDCSAQENAFGLLRRVGASLRTIVVHGYRAQSINDPSSQCESGGASAEHLFSAEWDVISPQVAPLRIAGAHRLVDLARFNITATATPPLQVALVSFSNSSPLVSSLVDFVATVLGSTITAAPVFVGTEWLRVDVALPGTFSSVATPPPPATVWQPVTQWVLYLHGTVAARTADANRTFEDTEVAAALHAFLLGSRLDADPVEGGSDDDDGGIEIVALSTTDPTHQSKQKIWRTWQCSEVVISHPPEEESNHSWIRWSASCWCRNNNYSDGGHHLWTRTEVTQSSEAAEVPSLPRRHTAVPMRAETRVCLRPRNTTDDGGAPSVCSDVTILLRWKENSSNCQPSNDTAASRNVSTPVRLLLPTRSPTHMEEVLLAITSYAMVPLVAPRPPRGIQQETTTTTIPAAFGSSDAATTMPCSSTLKFSDAAVAEGAIRDSMRFAPTSSSLSDALVPITVVVLGAVGGALLLTVFVFRVVLSRRRVLSAVLATLCLLVAVACVILVGVGLDGRHDAFPKIVVIELFQGHSCSANPWSPAPFQVLFLDAAQGDTLELVNNNGTTNDASAHVCPEADARLWSVASSNGLRWSRVTSLGDPVGSPGLSTRAAALCSSTLSWVRLRATSTSSAVPMASLVLPHDQCTRVTGLPWLSPLNSTAANAPSTLDVFATASCHDATAVAGRLFRMYQQSMNVWFDMQRRDVPVLVADARNSSPASPIRFTSIDPRSFFRPFEDADGFRGTHVVAISTERGPTNESHPIAVDRIVEQQFRVNGDGGVNNSSPTPFNDPIASSSKRNVNIAAAFLSNSATTRPISSVADDASMTSSMLWWCNETGNTELPAMVRSAGTCPAVIVLPEDEGGRSASHLLRYIGAEGTAFNPSSTTHRSEPIAAATVDDSHSGGRRDPDKDPLTILWFQRITHGHSATANVGPSIFSSTVFSVTDTLWSSSSTSASMSDAASAVNNNSSSHNTTSAADSNGDRAVLLQHQALASERLDYALRHGLLEDPGMDADLQDGSVLSRTLGTYAARPASVLKDALRGGPVSGPARIADPLLSVYSRVTVTSAVRGCSPAAGDCADGSGGVHHPGAPYMETTIRLSSLPSEAAVTTANGHHRPTTLVWRLAEPLLATHAIDARWEKDTVRELSGLSTIERDKQERVADGSWHLMGIVCSWEGGRRQCQLHVDGATSVSALGWRQCAPSGCMAMPDDQGTQGSLSLRVASAAARSVDGIVGGGTFSPGDTLGSFGEVQIGPSFASGGNSSNVSSRIEVAHVVVLPAALRRSEIRSIMGVSSLSDSEKAASYALCVVGIVAAVAALVRAVFDLARSIWRDRKARQAQLRREKRRMFEGSGTAIPTSGADEDAPHDAAMPRAEEVMMTTLAGTAIATVESDQRQEGQEGDMREDLHGMSTAWNRATARLRKNLEEDLRRRNVGAQLSLAGQSASSGMHQVSRTSASTTATTSGSATSTSRIATHLHYLLASVLNVGQVMSIYFANWSWPPELTNVSNALVRWLTIDWNFNVVPVHTYVVPALAVALTGAVALLYWAVIDDDEAEFCAMVQRLVGPASPSPPATSSALPSLTPLGPLGTTTTGLCDPPIECHDHVGEANDTLPRENRGESAEVSHCSAPAEKPQQQHHDATSNCSGLLARRAALMSDMEHVLAAQRHCLEEQNALKAQGATQEDLAEADPLRIAFISSLHTQQGLIQRQQQILEKLTSLSSHEPSNGATLGEHPSTAAAPLVLAPEALAASTNEAADASAAAAAAASSMISMDVSMYSPVAGAGPHAGGEEAGGSKRKIQSFIHVEEEEEPRESAAFTTSGAPRVSSLDVATIRPTSSSVGDDNNSSSEVIWLAHLWTSEGRRVTLDPHAPAFANAVTKVIEQCSNLNAARGVLGMSEMTSCRIGLPRRAVAGPALQRAGGGTPSPPPELLYYTASFTATLTRAPAGGSSPKGGSFSADPNESLILQSARKAVDNRCEEIRTRVRHRRKLKEKYKKLEQQRQHREEIKTREIGSMVTGDDIPSSAATKHERTPTSSNTPFEPSDDEHPAVLEGGEDNHDIEGGNVGGVHDAIVIECYLSPEGNALDGGHRGFVAIRPLHGGVRCPHHNRRLGMAFEVHKHAHKYNDGDDDDENDAPDFPQSVQTTSGGAASSHAALYAGAQRRRRTCAYHSVMGRGYRLKRGLEPCPTSNAHLDDDADFYLCPHRWCRFTVCDACFEGSPRDVVSSVIVGAVDALRRMGAVQVLGFLVILLSQLILAPVMQTCVMVLFCHAKYQCQFPGCYIAPSVTFLIFACLAAVTLAVAVFGVTSSLVIVTLRRKRLIVSLLIENEAAPPPPPPPLAGEASSSSGPSRLTWWMVVTYRLPNDVWRLLLDRDRSMLRSLYEPYRFRFIWFHPVWMVCRATVVLPAVFGDPDSLGQLGGAWGVELLFLLMAAVVPLYSDRWVTFLSRMASIHQVAQVSLNMLYQTLEDERGLEASGVVNVPSSSTSTRGAANTSRALISAFMLWLFVAYLVTVVLVLLAAVVVPFLWQRHLRNREAHLRAKVTCRRARSYALYDNDDDAQLPRHEPPKAPRGDPRGWRSRYAR